MSLMWCSCNYLKLIILKYALLFPDSLCLNGDYSHELVAMSINESKGISQILSNCTTGHCHFRKQNKLTKSLTVLLLFFLLFNIARHASQHEACTPVILNSSWSVFSISSSALWEHWYSRFFLIKWNPFLMPRITLTEKNYPLNRSLWYEKLPSPSTTA